MSEGTKAQYQILAEMKRIEEKLIRLDSEARRIPEELSKLDEAIKARRQEFDKSKSTFDTSEKSLRSLEGDLREREDKLKKAESKMMEVKTNEEYQAAMKENQGQKDEKTAVEEKVLTLISNVEEGRTKIKGAEDEYKSYEKTINEDKTRLEQDRSKLVALIEEQLSQKNELASRLSPEVHELYNRVAPRVKGASIVVVENGMCLGCNMKIRPQLYNEVIGYKTVHRCPSCGRLLIMVPKDASGNPAGDLSAK